MRVKTFLMTLALGAATTAVAQAETHLGWYVAADGGAHKTTAQKITLHDVKLEKRTETQISQTTTSGSSASSSTLTEPTYQPAPNIANDARLRSEKGFAGFLRVGYRFSDHWRAEGELGRREATISRRLTGQDAASVKGDLTMDSAMVNILYDFAPDRRINPFIGIGAGKVRLDTDFSDSLPVSAPYLVQEQSFSTKKTFNGYQFLAGFSWRVSDRVHFDFTYRDLRVNKVSYKGTLKQSYTYDISSGCINCVDPPSGKTSPAIKAAPQMSQPLDVINATYRVDEDYSARFKGGRLQDQSVTFGVRIAFGGRKAPAPMPYEEPAPEPAPLKPQPDPLAPKSVPMATAYGPQMPAKAQDRQYTVYFNFDQSRLTAQGANVVHEAADYAKTGARSVIVTGHADTSGSAAYNIGLSQRRALNVAERLKTLGVNGGIIQTQWKGENEPNVRTKDGTPNAQNRRTTIDIRF